MWHSVGWLYCVKIPGGEIPMATLFIAMFHTVLSFGCTVYCNVSHYTVIPFLTTPRLRQTFLMHLPPEALAQGGKKGNQGKHKH